MDRRKLILAGAVLSAPVLTGRALAQTALPPARPRMDEAPPDNSLPSYTPSNVPDPAGQHSGQYQEPAPRYQADEPRYDERPRQYAQNDGPPAPNPQPQYAARTYERDEIVDGVSDFLGVTAESAGAAIERIFRQHGRPTGYIAGEEGSGAIGLGLRYGKGLLYMKDRGPTTVYWRGPSIGWDLGGNASRSFTLCYALQRPDQIFQRFPGVEGSAYLVGGLGVNYQRADDIVLAPIRAGVGLRLGANLGYLAYSRRRRIVPL